MTSKQEDRLSMYIVVDAYLQNADSATLALMPNFSSLFNRFKNNVDLIRSKSFEQGLNRKGNRMTKEEYRNLLIEKTLNVSNRVKAYASEENNLILKQEVSFVYSSLNRLRDAHLPDVCQGVHTIAVANLANLATYGVTEPLLNSLRETILGYNSYLPLPRTGIVTRKLLTTQIAELFEENKKLIERLDELVEMIKTDHPEFTQNYFFSRKIIDTGHIKLALRGTIVDQDGMPINKVSISIATIPEQETKSTEKGYYQFKTIPDGQYQLLFKREGYYTESILVNILQTTRLQCNVIMQSVEENQLSA